LQINEKENKINVILKIFSLKENTKYDGILEIMMKK
jgi:hypothetical protein